ncbi:MAG: hypothetical protein WCA20_04050 [Candidatus Sulfotelmatobacter sp.]
MLREKAPQKTHAHSADPTRLVSAALQETVAAKRITTRVDDPIANGLDVMGINEYIGWYSHLAADADATERTSAYDKPLIMSEFGADAPFGYQGDALSRWIEE